MGGETYKYQSLDTLYKVRLEKHQYANGRTALILVDADDGEQVACVTVNLPEHDIQPGEIIVKTWSENEKMLDFLVRNNIVIDTGRDVPTGFVKARVCRLMV
jgi:hypothetical protein